MSFPLRRSFPVLLAAMLLGACAAPMEAAAPVEGAAAADPGPVAAVRVAFDRNGVTGARATGMADLATGREVTADDPTRVASISKLVVAIGVMRLVEAGTLDLDADVSELLGWRLRHPEFPEAPISLRLLLSHTSALTDDAGYWQTPLDGELKNLLDDPEAWNAGKAPGSWFQYANLNFPLVASVMETATGERFDLLMKRLVFDPLDVDACYGWSACDDDVVARAVVQYRADRTPAADDNGGGRPACPVQRASDGGCDLGMWKPGVNGGLFGPQGGMRISARDLAKIGRLLLGGGTVDGVTLLSPASVRELVTPQWSLADGGGTTFESDASGQSREGFFCRYGLSAQTLATPHEACRDDPFGDGVQRVGHSGSAYGLLSGLWVDLEGGTGVVYYATGMSDAPAGADSAFTAIEEALARDTPW